MLGISSEKEKNGDEPSSLLEQYQEKKTQLQSALEVFRENWKHELQPIAEANSNGMEIEEYVTQEKEEDDETKAQRLFQLGVDYERRGKVYDALQYYRKAVQIIPDIEFRAYDTSKKQALSTEAKNQQTSVINNVKSTETRLTSDNDDEDFSSVDLYEKFQNDLLDQDKLISSTIDSHVLTTELHISDLPTEIILYIFRWVISSQLDLKSLEQCAAVCKGFYICGRDEKIWKQACTKIWGMNTDSLLETPYISWRQMFIERNRVIFNGCYISKTKYIRYGENSFQSEFYRPIQVIEYYRYFRFLPDGTVFMMTTTDEPAQGVSKLKNVKDIPSDVLCGHYRIHDDVVILMIKKQLKSAQVHPKRRSTMAVIPDLSNSNTYHIEFRITNVSSKKRFAKLVWKHYSITQVKIKSEIQIPFELTASNFPPLWFSQVRSYHLEADAPL